MLKVSVSDAYISFYDGEGTRSYACYAPYGWTVRSAWKDYFRSARVWKTELAKYIRAQ